MALPVAVSDINAFTNKYIVPRMTDVTFKESPLFVRLLSKNKVDFEGGTSIQRPILYNKLNGGAYSKGATFNVAVVQTDTAYNVNMKYTYVNVSLYGEDDVLNRGKEAAFSYVESKMANASMRMAELIVGQIYGDGQTSAADVATAGLDSSSGLPILTTSESLDGLLAWIDDGNDNATNYTTATDYTKSFTSIGGLTRSDLFASAPSFTGVTATPTSAIGGANAYTERAFTNFQLSAVNKAYGKAWFGNRYVDLMIGQQATYDKFWNAIQPNQRFTEQDTDLAKIGFQSLRFNAASLVVDKYAPTNVLFGLNTNFIEFYVTKNPKYQFGFTGFKEMPNSTQLAGQHLFAGAIVVPSPRCNFKLLGTGLS